MRLHPSEKRVAKLSAETPATFVAFDCLLSATGKSLLAAPFEKRRQALEALFARIGESETFRMTPFTLSRRTALGVAQRRARALDGVVAKRLDLPYMPGERAMLKVKNLRTADCVVGGFRYESNRPLVGSLLLGLYDEKGLLHHVGFTSALSARGEAGADAAPGEARQAAGLHRRGSRRPEPLVDGAQRGLAAARPEARRRGALRPRDRRPLPPRHQARPLAPGQGAPAMHVRADRARARGVCKLPMKSMASEARGLAPPQFQQTRGRKL